MVLLSMVRNGTFMVRNGNFGVRNTKRTQRSSFVFFIGKYPLTFGANTGLSYQEMLRPCIQNVEEISCKFPPNLI